MKTILIKTKANRLRSTDLDICIRALQKGGLVIFPTDTVYGIASNAFLPDAVKKICALKGRRYTKPLPILLSSVSQLPLVADDISSEAKSLIQAFWPGPLTLVFKTGPLALHASQGRKTIAVRVPDHGVVKQILEFLQLPLATTSANKSGAPSCHTGAQARKLFMNKVDVIIDGGRCPLGRESTVVDVSHYPFSLLRRGALPVSKITAVVPV